MPIIDLCKQVPVTIEGSASIKEAAYLMMKHNLGGLIVVETALSRRPLGVITDRDIALNLAREHQIPRSKVRQIMSEKLFTMSAESGIADVVAKMEKENVKKIVIVNSKGDACGIVSTDDILELLAREVYSIGKVSNYQLKNGKRNNKSDSTDLPQKFSGFY